MNYSRDLILGKAFCIFIFFHFSDSRISVLKGFYFYLCFLTWVKTENRGREHKTTIFRSFSELRHSFSESTPGKGHNNWQIEWNGIRVCNEVWNSTNSLFNWRSRCRWRRGCLRSPFHKKTLINPQSFHGPQYLFLRAIILAKLSEGLFSGGTALCL